MVSKLTDALLRAGDLGLVGTSWKVLRERTITVPYTHEWDTSRSAVVRAIRLLGGTTDIRYGDMALDFSTIDDVVIPRSWVTIEITRDIWRDNGNTRIMSETALFQYVWEALQCC